MKRNDFSEGVELLEESTILDFYESDMPDILVTCENISPKPDEEGHFVAGEGGPSVIINASRYAVILLGKIALYRPESCDTPQVATHEILHALGFDHNSNQASIMYPITNCDQEIGRQLIEDINNLYSVPTYGDLLIESVQANKSGRYLSFEAVIVNYGLKDIEVSTLTVMADNEVVGSYDTGDISVGGKKTMTITNLKVPRNTERFSLSVETPEPELMKDNNIVELSVVDDGDS